MNGTYSSWWKRKILYKIPGLYRIQPCGNYHPFWDRLCSCRRGEHTDDFHGGVLDLKTGEQYQPYDEKLERLRARIQRCKVCGTEYLANSHEYPCPWCEVAKAETCYVNPDMEHQAEEAECANMFLDDLKVLRTEGYAMLSLVGRIKYLVQNNGGQK